MSSHGVLITDCVFDAGGCAQPHRIVYDGDAQIWFVYDDGGLLGVVHRCGWPAMTATDQELLDLLAPLIQEAPA